MKIKNLVITGLVTGAIALSTQAGTITSMHPVKVEAASITESSYDVMNYFTENLGENVEEYLDKTKSSTNLNKLLGYYDTLYDFVNNGKYVKSTYYRNLPYYEQETLQRMLNNWGNEIYDLYKNTSYFKSNCKSKLGFYLTYESDEYGYDKDHEKTMEHYTETQDEKLENYLDKSNSQTNLKNALDLYKNLVNFVKGNTRSYGYIFSELTLTEQEEIINLLEDWTNDIEYEYDGYSYYSSSCISRVGWTVNMNNLNRELGEYIENNNGYNPTYPSTPTLPTTPTTPGAVPPAVPTTPSVQTPSVQPTQPAPVVPSVPEQVPTSNINNTVGKDWRQNYIDPSINTSRGVSDFVPRSVDEVFEDDEYIRYPQNYYTNGYYDSYGNYYNYNTGYYEGYTPDYAPSKILK